MPKEMAFLEDNNFILLVNVYKADQQYGVHCRLPPDLCQQQDKLRKVLKVISNLAGLEQS